MKKMIILGSILLLSTHSFSQDWATETLTQEVKMRPGTQINLSTKDATAFQDANGKEVIEMAYFRKGSQGVDDAIVLVGKESKSQYVFNIKPRFVGRMLNHIIGDKHPDTVLKENAEIYEKFISLVNDKDYVMKLNPKDNETTNGIDGPVIIKDGDNDRKVIKSSIEAQYFIDQLVFESTNLGLPSGNIKTIMDKEARSDAFMKRVLGRSGKISELDLLNSPSNCIN